MGTWGAAQKWKIVRQLSKASALLPVSVYRDARRAQERELRVHSFIVVAQAVAAAAMVAVKESSLSARSCFHSDPGAQEASSSAPQAAEECPVPFALVNGAGAWTNAHGEAQPALPQLEVRENGVVHADGVPANAVRGGWHAGGTRVTGVDALRCASGGAVRPRHRPPGAP